MSLYHNHKDKHNLPVLLLAVFLGFIVLIFIGIDQYNISDLNNEALTAQISLEMLNSQDFFSQTYNSQPQTYTPPLINWAQALSMHFIGNNAFAARLPSAIFALVTLIAFFSFVEILTKNPRYAVISTAILGLNLPFVILSQSASSGMLSNLFIMLGTLVLVFNVYSKQRSNIILFAGGLYMSIALLAGGATTFIPPLAILILMLSMAPYQRSYRILALNPFILLSGILFLLFPIFMLINDLKGFEFISYKMLPNIAISAKENFLLRFSTFNGEYLLLLVITLFPWSSLLVDSIIDIKKRFWMIYNSEKAEDALPLIGLVWILAVILGNVFSPQISLNELFAVMPGLALLVGVRINRIEPISKRNLLLILPISILLGISIFSIKWIMQDLSSGTGIFFELYQLLSQHISILPTQFSSNTQYILAQDIYISIAPIIAATLIITGINSGFFLSCKNDSYGIVITNISLLLTLVMLNIGITPLIYKYFQNPLHEIAITIKNNTKNDYTGETSSVYTIGIDSPSLSFTSGANITILNKLDLSNELEIENNSQIINTDKRNFIIFKQSAKEDIKNRLPTKTIIECSGGYCLASLNIFK